MAVQLNETRKGILLTGIQSFYQEEFEEELSTFRAEKLLEFFLGALGPQVYNQAVQDARRFMLQKLDDLDGEVHVPDPV